MYFEPNVKDALTGKNENTTATIADQNRESDHQPLPCYEIVDNFESLLRAQSYGPANCLHSRWPPVPWQEAIKAIYCACKFIAKDFSKGAVLEMAADYVQYNYLSVDANVSDNVHTSTPTSELPSEASSCATCRT